jgi:hypothetical protein
VSWLQGLLRDDAAELRAWLIAHMPELFHGWIVIAPLWLIWIVGLGTAIAVGGATLTFIKNLHRGVGWFGNLAMHAPGNAVNYSVNIKEDRVERVEADTTRVSGSPKAAVIGGSASNDHRRGEASMTGTIHGSKSRSADSERFEYEQLLSGYHSRDETMSRTFYEMTQTFSFFLAIILGWRFLASENPLLFRVIQTVVSISGFIALFAFMIDMQGITSAKNAIRERCQELEGEMGFAAPGYWAAIDKRRKFWLETLVKPYTKDQKRERRAGGYGYLQAGILLLWVWLFLCTVMWYVEPTQRAGT